MSGTADLQNTIVASQAGGANCAVDPDGGVILDRGNNVTFGDTTCPATITNADPHLAPLADNGGVGRTMALGGPAGINGGTFPCPTIDQRLYPRVGTCDIGAFEAGAALADDTPPDVRTGSRWLPPGPSCRTSPSRTGRRGCRACPARRHPTVSSPCPRSHRG